MTGAVAIGQVLFWGVSGALLLYIGIPWAVRNAWRATFRSTVARSDCVCLTFDDGPDPRATSPILQMLEKAGARATFFLLGENVERYPDLARQILEMGHEIGEHGYRHVHAWKAGPLQSVRDLQRGRKVLRTTLLLRGPVLLRPPYGKLNLATLLYVLVLHKRLAFWSVDPRDYDHDAAESVVQDVMERVRPGDVVLLHDGRTGASGGENVTLMATKAILDAMATRGYRLCTVSQALAYGGDRKGWVHDG
jgi:peptidoglycan/xylan/chitin deacetylase (PgdA/CDA1 family)